MIDRRHLLAAGAALTLARPALAAWEPNRFPDPAIKLLDPSFAKYRLNIAAMERIVTGLRWCEGPVWFGDARALVWSDIANDCLMRWDEETGRTSVFRKPSNKANGNTRDRQGRLVTCEHTARRVTRTEYDGTVTVLADRLDGKRFNSPNDVVVRADDSIWFTDPPYGLRSDYVGNIGDPPELPNRVYRIDKSGRITVAVDDVNRPDGLALSADQKKLYVVDAGATPVVFRVYDVADDGKLTNGQTFITVDKGIPDGLRVDIDGNLWCGWGGGEGQDGVMVFNAAGKPIGRIDLPERCANVCFGGLKRNRLFMAASSSIYSLFVGTQGAPGG
jgi:gluconolactonase